jgi:Fur family transcriptional regulator, ferric uptake regulator
METVQQIHHLLKRNQLSVTESRSKILEQFLLQHGALAHGDIEKRTGSTFDRVTIYRTLQTFLEKGIIHAIPTADNAVRYALCKEDCSEGHHQDHHIHFICHSCGSTTCLEEVSIPELNLPNGYLSTQVEVVVNGVCKDCRG